MTLDGQTRSISAHSAGLAGLGAIAIALLINVGVGKLSFKNPALSASASTAQIVVAPSLPGPAPTSVADTTAAMPQETEQVMLASADAKLKPKVTLSRDQVWEVQAWLKAFKLDPGPVDGIPGPRTFTAVKAFETAHRHEETGNVDHALLGALRLESGMPLR